MILSLGEWLETIMQEKNSIIGDGVVVAGSLNGLDAVAKAGKTWFSLQLGLSVAGLAQFFITDTLAVHEFGKVLYLNAEISESMLKKRLQLILEQAKAKGLNVDMPKKNFYPVTVRGDMRLDSREGRERLVDTVTKIQPLLAIIDPIGALHSLDENSQQDMSTLLNFFLSVVNQLGVAIVLIHHQGKSVKGRQEIHHGRGSSVWGDRLDSSLSLIPFGQQSGGVRLQLGFVLRNGPPLDPMIIQRKNGEYLYTAVGQKFDTVALLEKLFKVNKVMNYQQLIDRYKASGRTSMKALQDAIKILESQGKLKRDRKGYPAQTWFTWQ